MTAALADPQAALLARGPADALADRPDWAPALTRLADRRAGLHLPVMTRPFLHLMLTGAKSVESRISRVRCAPWRALAPGDLIALKPSGRPVTAVALAGRHHVEIYLARDGQMIASDHHDAR